MLVKKMAGAVTLLEGVLAVIFGAESRALAGFGLVIDPLLPLAGIGVILVVDGVICVLEKEFAFWVGVLLSLLTVVYVAANLAEFGSLAILFAALALVVIVFDVKAIRSHPPVSEENHPLNLPVFG